MRFSIRREASLDWGSTWEKSHRAPNHRYLGLHRVFNISTKWKLLETMCNFDTLSMQTVTCWSHRRWLCQRRFAQAVEIRIHWSDLGALISLQFVIWIVRTLTKIWSWSIEDQILWVLCLPSIILFGEIFKSIKVLRETKIFFLNISKEAAARDLTVFEGCVQGSRAGEAPWTADEVLLIN